MLLNMLWHMTAQNLKAEQGHILTHFDQFIGKLSKYEANLTQYTTIPVLLRINHTLILH